MAVLEQPVAILRLVRTYPLLAVNLVVVAGRLMIQMLLAALVAVLWRQGKMEATLFHELAQMPLYMVNLVVVMLAPPEKVVTLLVLAAVLVVAVLLFRLVTLEVVLTKEVRVAALVGALIVPQAMRVALAVQILVPLVVVERLERQMEEPVALVPSGKAVVVAVLAPLLAVLLVLVVLVVLAAVLAVAAVRQLTVITQALVVLAAVASAVSTLGKELT